MKAEGEAVARPDVSVVIVSYNTRDRLRDCLKSVYAHTRGVRFEVIVSDNASADSSARMVREEFPQASVIENQRNLGFAGGCRPAIEASRGRYVLLLNPDSLLAEDAIGKAAEFADLHPRAAVTGCRVQGEDGEVQRSCFRAPSLWNALLGATCLPRLLPRSFGAEQYEEWDYDAQREVEAVSGCFFLMRREALDEIGPLDERFFMYCEDLDWCATARQKGWQVMYTPTARIVHAGRRSSEQIPMMFIERHRSKLMYWLKHKGRRGLQSYNLLLGAFFAARAPLHLARMLFARAGDGRPANAFRVYMAGVRWHARAGISLLGSNEVPRVPGVAYGGGTREAERDGGEPE